MFCIYFNIYVLDDILEDKKILNCMVANISLNLICS
jgi:hypothetical protein